MARLSPQPYREIKRRLEAAGFSEVSQKGSHVKFVRRMGSEFQRELNKATGLVGTLRSILNQAQIDIDEWETLA